MAPRRSLRPTGWYPRRGDVCLATLDKERPVIVISSDLLNRHSRDVCVVPISTAEHRVFSMRPFLRAGEGGLARDSWGKCDQVTTVEKRLVRYPPLGALSEVSLARIEGAIKQALELD